MRAEPDAACGTGTERRGSRLVRFIPAALAGVAAVALYGPVAAGLVAQWFTDADASHGLLLAAAAALVLFRRRARLRSLTPAPADSGFLILGFALLLYTVGTTTGDVFVLRVSLPIAVAGCVLALWGREHARATIAPTGLLLLAVPLPMVIVTYLTLPLQLIASRVAAETLDAAGVFVVQEGNVLILRDIALEVAEACSGLRSVVSLVSVAAICGALLPLPPARTALLMAAAVPIAVIGNGFRVAATGFLTTWFGPVAVRGLVHELTGFAAFLAMCAILVGVQALTARHTRHAAAPPRATLVAGES